MKIMYYCCLFWLISWRVAGQTTADPHLSVQQLREDVNYFRTALGQVHPGQYRYTSKRSFDSLFAATERQLTQPMSQHSFFRIMQPLVTALHCGHTKWIVSGKDEHFPFFGEKLFPVRLYVTGTQAWVVRTYGPNDLPKGAEILSINGKTMAAVIQQLLPAMSSANGFILTAKYEDLNQYFAGFYATQFGAAEAFRVSYRTATGEHTAMLPPVSESTIKAATLPQATNPFRLSFTAPATAVMTIDRFWSDSKEQDYKAFLKASFREMTDRKIEHLILDLRNNEGGEEPYGIRLFSYLINTKSPYYDHLTVRQRQKHHFPAWSPKIYRLARPFAVKKRNSSYHWTLFPGLKQVRPARDAFHGKLYVLINGNSLSVTTELASRLHTEKRATFIGQETGGGYEGNNSGFFVVTQLPHSKIDLGIPTFGFYMANTAGKGFYGRGILPDYPITPTINDILTGNDPAMQQALELINKTPVASVSTTSAHP